MIENRGAKKASSILGAPQDAAFGDMWPQRSRFRADEHGRAESYVGLQEALEELFQRSLDLVEYRPSRSLDLVLVYSRRWAAYRQ
jgi:hypothetical protein